MIRKSHGMYVVLSEHKAKTGKRRVLGRYKTKAAAVRRLRQVEYFKALKKHGRRG